MEIIKKGKPPGEDIFTGSCRACRSKMRFKRSEASETVWDQRESGEIASATCPVCKAVFYGYPEKR